MVLCPWCKASIEREVSGHNNWDEPEFCMSCPVCSEPLVISVEVEEYKYTAQKDEEGPQQ